MGGCRAPMMISKVQFIEIGRCFDKWSLDLVSRVLFSVLDFRVCSILELLLYIPERGLLLRFSGPMRTFMGIEIQDVDSHARFTSRFRGGEESS